MKRTFHQKVRDYIGEPMIPDAELRAILRWFGNSSLYFPTEQEKARAKSAFFWLYQYTAEHRVSLDPEAHKRCIASFSREFSLPADISERLLADYFHLCDTAVPTIIGIEGLDGSGKTVQAEMLGNALRRQGKKVRVIDFPQYAGFFGKEIGALLAGTGTVSAMELDEKSMCLWYALDRWKTVRGAHMEEYDYIIFNRYTLSSVVYQSARRYNGFDQEFADWIFTLEHTQLELPIPDLYIYLDTNTALCGKNVLKKGEREYVDGLDVYERSRELLLTCHDIYKALSQKIGEIAFLDCMDANGQFKSAEEISAGIMDKLAGLIAGPAGPQGRSPAQSAPHPGIL